jgi:hypothetical protein
MPKQQTREELVIALAVANESVKKAVEQSESTTRKWEISDENRREEFAKSFGWSKDNSRFGYSERTSKTPTWPEIFVEVGKLLACKDFRNLEGNVSELGAHIGRLERFMKGNKNKPEHEIYEQEDRGDTFGAKRY